VEYDGLINGFEGPIHLGHLTKLFTTCWCHNFVLSSFLEFIDRPILNKYD